MNAARRHRPPLRGLRDRPCQRHDRGFSLIELLTTMAGIAILSAIAIPSYSNYVKRGNRGDAQRLMTTISNRESQYLLDARAYTETVGAGGLNITTLDGWSCEATCTNGRYTVAVAVDGTAFSIVATPIGKQASDGTLRLTSSGARSRTVGDVDHGW